MKKKYNLDIEAVGKRLRETREELNMTLEKMSEISGFSKSLISSAEKGLKKPSAIYLFALLDQFGVNLNYIFNGKGQMFLPVPGAGGEGIKEEKNEAVKKTPAQAFVDEYTEMLYMIENSHMVKYWLLSNYLNYKTQNAQSIDKILNEREE
jgi:transcriptional regulator with XRE-family HTH domain